jgi:release factor glutamine methyltransferase
VSSGVTWRSLYAEAEQRLGSDVDARRIVERASGNEGAAFHTGLDEHVSVRALAFFDGMVERRAAGEPLQYVLGVWGFRTLDLYVDRRVLIPRPETEVVVEVGLAELAELAALRPRQRRHPVVVDLGTGSGAIALSFAAEGPADIEVWGTDRSADALAVARANLAGLGRAAARVRLVEGWWYDALPAALRGRVGVIVSNPPYVADSDDLPAEVADWEPESALLAGPSGMEQIAEVVKEAPVWLDRPGVLVVELAPHQADDAVALAYDSGFTEAFARPDLTGRVRVLVARV